MIIPKKKTKTLRNCGIAFLIGCAIALFMWIADMRAEINALRFNQIELIKTEAHFNHVLWQLHEWREQDASLQLDINDIIWHMQQKQRDDFFGIDD